MDPEADRVTAPPADASVWLRTSERGTAFALALVMLLCRWFGRAFTRVLIAPAIFYFVLFAPQARRASRDYLARLGQPCGFRAVYAHFVRFAHVTLDRLFFALGKLASVRDHAHRQRAPGRRSSEQRRGALLLGAHLGSFEAMRGDGDQHVPAAQHRRLLQERPSHQRRARPG